MSIELEDGQRRLGPTNERLRDPSKGFKGLVARIYDEHSGPVFALASHFCGAAVAASVVKEVFLQFARDWPQLDRTDASVRTYLLALTCRECVARSGPRRKPPRRVGRPSGSNAARSGDRANDRKSEAGVFGPLDTLPAHLADPIAIVYFGSCTYREAAVVLGVAPHVVKSRLREGLARASKYWCQIDSRGGERPS